MQEAGRLTKIPGIGKKTAERLLLELRDKLLPTTSLAGVVAPDAGAADRPRRPACVAAECR